MNNTALSGETLPAWQRAVTSPAGGEAVSPLRYTIVVLVVVCWRAGQGVGGPEEYYTHKKRVSSAGDSGRSRKGR